MKARIETVYTLRQPLSHIGESESTESFLNTVRIMGPDGPTECAVYTGNAIRGAWRDAGAKYLLDVLGIRVPKKAFHLLFSGGSIGGEQSIDIDVARNMRALMPLVSLLGGGIGTQILAGKLTQVFAYPVCAETARLIPGGIDGVDYGAQRYSWRQLTGSIQFSRKDDSKDLLGDAYISTPTEQTEMLPEPAVKKKGKKPADDGDGPSTQMRYATEYLIPGTQLWHQADFNGTEIELGALVSCIHKWAERPVLGGKCGSGFGMVDADIRLVSADGTRTDFITLRDGLLRLSEPAEGAKAVYDQHLHSLYDTFLLERGGDIVALLEGSAK